MKRNIITHKVKQNLGVPASNALANHHLLSHVMVDHFHRQLIDESKQ